MENEDHKTLEEIADKKSRKYMKVNLLDCGLDSQQIESHRIVYKDGIIEGFNNNETIKNLKDKLKERIEYLEGKEDSEAFHIGSKRAFKTVLEHITA